jgi:hypothetical protein
MKHLPHYTKVMTLGAAYTENALVGPIVLQEKVDGSQFRFGLTEEGKFLVGSKNSVIGHPDEVKMFKKGVEYLFKIRKLIKKNFKKDTYFFAEYLQKPKHNVLKYSHVPLNNIVLFDVLEQGKWVSRIRLEEIATFLKIDIIPELYKGELNTARINKSSLKVSSPAVDRLKRILETTPSFLGNETIEGVVIKNYNQTVLLGGNVFPLFTKYVREVFKERHNLEWKIKKPKDSVQVYINSFKNEARWQKAIIHLQEKGQLEKQPQDIGKLIKVVQQDIIEEEAENIKTFLYNKFSKEILRKAVRGLPEWYKEQLLKNLKGTDNV